MQQEIKMAKVLVTGGAGFIGSYVCEEALRHGDECHVVDNLFQDSFKNLVHIVDDIKFHHADITEDVQIKKIFEHVRPEIVFHLAAHHFIPFCNENPLEAIKVNVAATQHVVNMCKMYSVEKVFFASTAAVYGVSDKPHRETELPDPMDIYGVTKYCCEKILSFFHEKSKQTIIIGRLFNAIGKRETNPHVVPEIIEQVRRADFADVLYLGNIHPKRDYIHAGDIARAAYHSMVRAKVGEMDIVNIGSGCEYSVGEIVEMLSMLRSRKIHVRIDPDRVRAVDRTHLCADTTKLREQYKFFPRYSIKETLLQLLEEGNS